MSFHRRLGAGTGPLGSSGMVGLIGQPSFIRSIQRATISITGSSLTATATISSVDTNYSVVSNIGNGNGGTCNRALLAYVALTNSTTVTVTRPYQDGTNSTTMGCEVIEFNPGAIYRIQNFSMSYVGGQPSVTVTTYNTNKSFLFFRGMDWPALYMGDICSYASWPTITYTNSTTISGTIGGYGDGRVWCSLVEFF